MTERNVEDMTSPTNPTICAYGSRTDSWSSLMELGEHYFSNGLLHQAREVFNRAGALNMVKLCDVHIKLMAARNVEDRETNP